MLSHKRLWIRRAQWDRKSRLAAIGTALSAVQILLAGSGTTPAAERRKLEYNRDVRPILAENCFPCHGPDSAARKADLRLDQREVAVDAGAIAPGDPESSELVARISAKDPKELMPPPKTSKKLSEEQKDTLRRWIAGGAEYQLHWSLIQPKRPQVPKVHDASWTRNPIDQFVVAKLEEHGLKPAPEADRRTLARRLSLDLTGLPPSVALVELFVNDTAPEAYESLVTRLLNSPEWGEHRARYWLDVARYADTNGYHFDNYREAWAYRDWVMAAFNRNMPFDRFTIEQLAGDLLPRTTLDQQVASGFNRCNMTTNEGGAIPEEYQVLYTRDRTETVSLVWMGLTAGCAVCHEHKFDPLSQREFYELAAFFNNTTQQPMDGNVKDTPPTLFTPVLADRARWDSLTGELSAVQAQLDARRQAARPEFARWLAAADPVALAALVPSNGLRLATGEINNDPEDVFQSADAGDFEKDQPFSFGAWVKLAKSDSKGSVLARMDEEHGHRGWDLYIENGRVATHIVSAWPDDALKVSTTAEAPSGVWTHLFLTYDGSAKASGVKAYINGAPQATSIAVDSLRGSIRAKVPLKAGQRHRGARLEGASISSLRIYDRALAPGEVARLAGAGRAAALARTAPEKRSSEALDLVFAWWSTVIDPASNALRDKLAKLEAQTAAIRERGTYAHVMHERSEPAMAFLLYRGEYDKRRDPVKPTTPRVLPAMPPELPRNRLGLAKWLVRPEHPLTARVTVNRFWQEVFGAGLVRTSGDFGVSGELPSHPELLDWLAVDFRESGWDVKRLFRLIVESATYRQSAACTKEQHEQDPHNRLLSRGPRFRMDAEMIRDSALAVSGLLVPAQQGPSVRPYQPDGVWEAVAMPESNTHFYHPDHGASLYRRSLYTFWKRSAPPASMEILNAPSREICTMRRERTNTPLQALLTLNDPQFVEAARVLAEAVLKYGGTTPDERIDTLARRVLGRPFRSAEQDIARASLGKLSAYYQSHPQAAEHLIQFGESRPEPADEPVALAAWTMLANELMNLDEFLNK
jgi:hypothetical protein